MHDHTYAAKPVDLDTVGKDLTENQHLVKLLYTNHVNTGTTELKDLETHTRLQADCELWHQERKL